MLSFSQSLYSAVLHDPQTTTKLENVEHCGGEPEQADTGYYVTDR